MQVTLQKSNCRPLALFSASFSAAVGICCEKVLTNRRKRKSKKTNLKITTGQAVFTVGVLSEVQDKRQVLHQFCCVCHLEIEKNIRKYKMTKFTNRQEYLPRLVLVLAVAAESHGIVVQDFVERAVLTQAVRVAHCHTMVLLNKKYISQPKKSQKYSRQVVGQKPEASCEPRELKK